MDAKILHTINYHTNQLAKNFGLQEADKEDVRGKLTLKALSIIEDFEEGEASLVTYVKRCLENKASDIARQLRGLPPTVNNNNAMTTLDIEEEYKYSTDRSEDYVPLTISMGGQLQHLSVCDHEHDLKLKLDIEAIMSTLTPRQIEIVEMLEDGKTQEQIAEILGDAQQRISEQINTLRTIFQKLQ